MMGRATSEYRVFGCDTVSGIALPGLPPATGAPEVTIRVGTTPHQVSQPRGGGVCYSAGPGEALIDVPGVGRFHVRNGQEIVVQPAERATEDALRLFLLHTAFGVLLHQRDCVVLHAAVVDAEGGCVALAGASSTGKSTVAAAVQARGGRVLSDELCVVRQHGERSVVAPGPAYLHVWGDALDRLGHDTSRLAPIRRGIDKYVLPLGAAHVVEPRWLRTIYILNGWNQDAMEVERLTGHDRFQALVQHTYHFPYLYPMGLRSVHFARIATLVSQVTVVRVRHPHGDRGLDGILELLTSRHE